LGLFSEVKTRPGFGSGVLPTKSGFLPHMMRGGELGNPGFPMGDPYLRVLVRFAGSAGRERCSISFASLSARRRCMFLRTATAFRSTSAIARAPSSRSRRRLLARAILSGEGSLDFLPAIFSSPENASPPDPAIGRAAANKVKPGTGFPR
jgi:hypothetical protein